MSPRLAALGSLLLGLTMLHACSNTTEPEVEAVPAWGPVRAARLQATEHAGELLLSWIPPLAQEGLPALQRYEIVHSRRPISDAAFDSLPPLDLVHGEDTERHELRVKNLELTIPHHFRIRAVDEWGRAGQLSEQLSGTPAVFGAFVYLPEEDYLVAEYGKNCASKFAPVTAIPSRCASAFPRTRQLLRAAWFGACEASVDSRSSPPRTRKATP